MRVYLFLHIDITQRCKFLLNILPKKEEKSSIYTWILSSYAYGMVRMVKGNYYYNDDDNNDNTVLVVNSQSLVMWLNVEKGSGL